MEQIKSQAQITYIIKENNQIVLSALGYVSSSTQQNTGRLPVIVKDQSGEPVIGANIVEKGTTNGTITDIDGQYSLKWFEQYFGCFLYRIHYAGNSGRKEQYVGCIIEEDTETLDEVIVIGYGTTKRKDFTGSVSSVKLENSPIALSPNLNALESLKGNVSGLDIGATNSAVGSRACRCADKSPYPGRMIR